MAVWERIEPWLLRATVAGAFVLAASAGWQSLSLQHANGDQRAYVGIAMKLGTFGPKPSAYNLHGIGVRPENETVVYFPQFTGEGDLLRRYAAEGTAFYDQPLFHAPPLYPALLSLSHGLLASDRPHSVLLRDENRPGFRAAWRAQAWAVLPTVLCALLWLVVCYRLGREFGGPWMGAGCVLLLAASPAYLLVLQRLWADTLLGLCMTLAVWIFLRERRDNRLLLTGLFLGLALLTKNSGLLLLLPLVVGAGYAGHGGGWVGLAKIFGIAALLTVLWYAQAIRFLGTPFFNLTSPGISEHHPWFQFINSRPWYTYLVGMPYQNPIFALAVLGWPMLAHREDRKYWPLAAWALGSLFLLSVSVSRSEMLGPDHRYLLPAYPAFALLALTVGHRIGLRFRPAPSRLVLGLIVLWSAAWSLHVWWPLRGGDLLAVPF